MATADFDIPSPLPSMPAASVTSAKQAHRTARVARTEYVSNLVDALVTLVAAFTTVVGYSPNPKHQTKLTKAAEDKKKHYVSKIESMRRGFAAFSKPALQYKKVAAAIRAYNTTVNWINMLTVQFRTLDQAARDKLSEFEQFILNHRFPMYDFTNGFESDDDVEARITALMNPVQTGIVSKSDGVTFDPSDIPDGLRFLKASQRSVILATDDDTYFMGCLKAGIENADLVDADTVQTPQRVTKFVPDYHDGRLTFGTFGHYCLNLKFRDATSEAVREFILPSSCAEISRRFTSIAERDEFNKLCKRRIVSVLTAHDPERQQNEIVVFCQHPDCAHADGFLFRKRPTRPEDYHRTGPQCPSGHAFCVRCLQQDHDGFCPDVAQERAELAAMPGQKMCPTCRAIIFKNGGCNHMTCTSCGQHFCWTCNMRFNASEQYRAHGTCRQFDH